MSPEVCITPIFSSIMFYNSISLLEIQISNIQIVESSREHPLRHWLYNLFELTAMLAHFKGQTSPEARIPPIFLMIVGYSLQYLLVNWVSHIKMLKFLMDEHYDLVYAVISSSRPCLLIFKVKETLKRA